MPRKNSLTNMRLTLTNKLFNTGSTPSLASSRESLVATSPLTQPPRLHLQVPGDRGLMFYETSIASTPTPSPSTLTAGDDMFDEEPFPGRDRLYSETGSTGGGSGRHRKSSFSARQLKVDEADQSRMKNRRGRTRMSSEPSPVTELQERAAKFRYRRASDTPASPSASFASTVQTTPKLPPHDHHSIGPRPHLQSPSIVFTAGAHSEEHNISDAVRKNAGAIETAVKKLASEINQRELDSSKSPKTGDSDDGVGLVASTTNLLALDAGISRLRTPIRRESSERRARRTTRKKSQGHSKSSSNIITREQPSDKSPTFATDSLIDLIKGRYSHDSMPLIDATSPATGDAPSGRHDSLEQLRARTRVKQIVSRFDEVVEKGSTSSLGRATSLTSRVDHPSLASQERSTSPDLPTLRRNNKSSSDFQRKSLNRRIKLSLSLTPAEEPNSHWPMSPRSIPTLRKIDQQLCQTPPPKPIRPNKVLLQRVYMQNHYRFSGFLFDADRRRKGRTQSQPRLFSVFSRDTVDWIGVKRWHSNNCLGLIACPVTKGVKSNTIVLHPNTKNKLESALDSAKKVVLRSKKPGGISNLFRRSRALTGPDSSSMWSLNSGGSPKPSPHPSPKSNSTFFYGRNESASTLSKPQTLYYTETSVSNTLPKAFGRSRSDEPSKLITMSSPKAKQRRNRPQSMLLESSTKLRNSPRSSPRNRRRKTTSVLIEGDVDLSSSSWINLLSFGGKKSNKRRESVNELDK